MSAIRCEFCDTVAVVKTDRPQIVVYGRGDAKAEIVCTVPVFECAGCGEMYTDHEAEEIRDAAVRDHLAKLKA